MRKRFFLSLLFEAAIFTIKISYTIGFKLTAIPNDAVFVGVGCNCSDTFANAASGNMRCSLYMSPCKISSPRYASFTTKVLKSRPSLTSLESLSRDAACGTEDRDLMIVKESEAIQAQLTSGKIKFASLQQELKDLGVGYSDCSTPSSLLRKIATVRICGKSAVTTATTPFHESLKDTANPCDDGVCPPSQTDLLAKRIEELTAQFRLLKSGSPKQQFLDKLVNSLGVSADSFTKASEILSAYAYKQLYGTVPTDKKYTPSQHEGSMNVVDYAKESRVLKEELEKDHSGALTRAKLELRARSVSFTDCNSAKEIMNRLAYARVFGTKHSENTKSAAKPRNHENTEPQDNQQPAADKNENNRHKKRDKKQRGKYRGLNPFSALFGGLEDNGDTNETNGSEDDGRGQGNGGGGRRGNRGGSSGGGFKGMRRHSESSMDSLPFSKIFKELLGDGYASDGDGSDDDGGMHTSNISIFVGGWGGDDDGSDDDDNGGGGPGGEKKLIFKTDLKDKAKAGGGGNSKSNRS